MKNLTVLRAADHSKIYVLRRTVDRGNVYCHGCQEFLEYEMLCKLEHLALLANSHAQKVHDGFADRPLGAGEIPAHIRRPQFGAWLRQQTDRQDYQIRDLACDYVGPCAGTCAHCKPNRRTERTPEGFVESLRRHGARDFVYEAFELALIEWSAIDLDHHPLDDDDFRFDPNA